MLIFLYFLSMDFVIPTTAITQFSTMAAGVGTGSITNIGLLSGVLGTIVVVLFARGLIFRGLGKLGI